ncbi:GNAT family N-acetyltransferase [Muricauda sp. SCSIO 64092]|uniref:GNAT family N-acetyltransferase n=1 Tax=Allomuricauda sp. SCSIO 64092 TaxID=2908842 RepID=UPI001FF38253|nr:GNAT family N-acetyltransferase [Muricauda sp. SCSIO 64092]UOY07995.1 GNAT family N-acetyltransferase [Muricauda sp. SCSIO 64092]
MKEKWPKNIRVEERKFQVTDYQRLRGQTNWDAIADWAVGIALENDLYGVAVFDGPNMVGMGRVIGDGAIYFYVQDIIVHPKYRGQGLGRLIMEHIENYLKRAAVNNSFVGLMAARDSKGFYEKFGFKERGIHSPGMFKIIEKTELNGFGKKSKNG